MSKKPLEKEVSTERRDFLKTAGLAGGVAVLAVTTEASAEVEPTESGSKQSLGYRETEHVRAYYQSARI